MEDSAGRVVVVTGGGSGIGRAVVHRFVSSGATVAVLDRDVEAARETLALADHDDGLAIACDVSDPHAVDRAFTTILESAHGVDVVVNAAGVGSYAWTHELSRDEWDRILSINATGTFLVCRRALEPLLAGGGGAIVNIASVSGLRGRAHAAAYCASKGAVIALSRTLAAEYASRGVRVNVVAPGGVDTPLVTSFRPPEGSDARLGARTRSLLDRLADPEEIATAVVQMASPSAGFVVGATMIVDGGASL